MTTNEKRREDEATMKTDTALPPDLIAAIDGAARALARDPRGNLERGQRQAVWAALGPRDSVGRRRRVRLAALAVERAMPVWERAFPGDETPRQLLALAALLAAGRADPKAARAAREAAFSAMDTRSDMAQDKMPVAVGYGAVQALSAALADEVFDPGALDPQAKDEDAQPEEHDASYFAAGALSGGPPWEPRSSAEARRELFTWWLREAVPAAFRSAEG